MCTFLEDGVQMSDGEKIKWETDPSNIPEKYVKELMDANMYERFWARRSQHETSTKLQALTSMLETNMSSFNLRLDGFELKLLSKEDLKTLIREEMVNYPQQTLDKVAKFVKNVGIIIVSISASASFVYGAVKFFTSGL